MVNDYIEIDTVESAMIQSEIRGTSYNPEVGYSYDSDNTTASLAKWVSTQGSAFRHQLDRLDSS